MNQRISEYLLGLRTVLWPGMVFDLTEEKDVNAAVEWVKRLLVDLDVVDLIEFP